MVYKYMESEHGTLDGFVESSLSGFYTYLGIFSNYQKPIKTFVTAF